MKTNNPFIWISTEVGRLPIEICAIKSYAPFPDGCVLEVLNSSGSVDKITTLNRLSEDTISANESLKYPSIYKLEANPNYLN